MPRLTQDPHLVQPPPFESEEFRAVYANLATAERPVETIIAELKAAWTQNNEAQRAAWNAQVEQDQADKEAADAAEAQAAKEAAEAEKREKEKKKAKLKAFVPNKPIGVLTSRRPPRYAIHKLEQFEYIELYYFTKEASLEAEKTEQTVTKDGFTFASNEDQTIVVKPAALYQPAKKVIQDQDLDWHQLMLAKDHLIAAMENADWPEAHVMALGLFFLELGSHPLHDQEGGKDALLLYQARVRRRWMEDLKSSSEEEVFDIGVIDDKLLNCLYSEVLNKRQALSILRCVGLP